MSSLLKTLTSGKQALDLSPAAFGLLQSSADASNRPAELRRRLEENGYLYLPGFLDREQVLSARAELISRLAAQGLLDSASPASDAVWNPEQRTSLMPNLAFNNAPLLGLVYGPELLAFYEALFGEPVLHFDHTWVRAVGPGKGTLPHCDLPYMGRGTRNLLTCWIPYGDISLELGGLMILEGSHRQSDRIRQYLETDVDSYCENRSAEVERVKEKGGWSHPGHLSTNPVTLREKLGGRWLTAGFQAGDILTFPMHLVHASLDNATDRIRFSSDTRYQRASEPVDERWIGVNPPGHSTAGKRGRIC
jgi:hypothetical protein